MASLSLPFFIIFLPNSPLREVFGGYSPKNLFLFLLVV